MSGTNDNKKYSGLKIPSQGLFQEDPAGKVPRQPQITTQLTLDNGIFYEIEYEPDIKVNTDNYLPPSQKIEQPEKDPIRDLFYRMRDISRKYRNPFSDSSRFYEQRTKRENAKIFYEQALFMQDFRDDYPKEAPLSAYFPNYQMMSYEQLRTYFTWRTEIRNGNINNISLSYAFIYVYELLNNIGVENPQEGLDKLMIFRNAYSVYDESIDKYILRWVKDYHIYYTLEKPFKEFIKEHKLEIYYPKITDYADDFEDLCAISKYDIRKSAFFTENKKLVTDCFYSVINRLREVLGSLGICFDDTIFQPAKKRSDWTPFKDALFCQSRMKEDKCIVFSENEVYIYDRNQNRWSLGKIAATESSKSLIAYVMKQMESELRKAMKYKYKLTANINTFDHIIKQKLTESGLSLEKTINDETANFYREATKTVVTVDPGRLTQIRQEALVTQDKLIVPEEPENTTPIKEIPVQEVETTPAGWDGFKTTLNDLEVQALTLILQNNSNIKQFADDNNIMLEVLADNINEKAMDNIGDNLLDDEFTIFNEYENQVKEMVGLTW